MLNVVEGFVFGRRHVGAVAVDAAVVEPVHPFQGGDFDLVDGASRAAGLISSVLCRPLMARAERAADPGVAVGARCDLDAMRGQVNSVCAVPIPSLEATDSITAHSDGFS